MNNKSRRHTSIDGISSGKKTTPKTGSLNFGTNNLGQSASSSGRQIGDFKHREGLSQASNTIIQTPKRPAYDSDKGNNPKRFFIFPAKKSKKLGGIDYYDKKKAKRRKRLKIVGIVILILLATFGFLVAKGYINLRKVLPGGGGAVALEQNVDPNKLRGEGDGRINILLLGRGGEGHAGPDLTDTIILASIDPIAKEAGLVSIPRDLYVTVPEVGSMKINGVYATGKSRILNNSAIITEQVKTNAENEGFKLLKTTVEETLGIPVHYKAIVDFEGFKSAIDTVGGIDLYIPKTVREQMLINGMPYTLDIEKGTKHLGGFEALAYSRSRHTTIRGDFGRSERQKLIISATKEKVFSLGTFANPAKLSELLDNFGSHVQTDFSIDDVSRLYEIVKEIDQSKIKSLDLTLPPSDFLTTSNIGGLSVVVPKAGLDNYKEVQYYIRNTLKDSFLKQENPSVIILNGTTRPSIAKQKKEELESYGYNVISVNDAPTQNYSKTMVVDLTNGEKKYTKRYLELRFNTLAINSLPGNGIAPGSANFVIILGSDISSQSVKACYGFGSCRSQGSPQL